MVSAALGRAQQYAGKETEWGKLANPDPNVPLPHGGRALVRHDGSREHKPGCLPALPCANEHWPAKVPVRSSGWLSTRLESEREYLLCEDVGTRRPESISAG